MVFINVLRSESIVSHTGSQVISLYTTNERDSWQQFDLLLNIITTYATLSIDYYYVRMLEENDHETRAKGDGT